MMTIVKKDTCPNCERITDIELIKKTEVIRVRNEEVEVEVEYYKCLECGDEFTSPHSGNTLSDVYREYRRRHNMLQPEDIRQQRERYGLTQQELSKLLGWGLVTLSRYENGALQSDAHEKALRLAAEPHNLIRLVSQNPNVIGSDEKRSRILKELKMIDAESCTFEKIYLDRFGDYQADELSGYKTLNLSKVFNAILFFCKDGTFKTRLNKFMFYADFKNYKETSSSITGLRYIHLQFGPVPDNYEYYFASLIHEKALSIEEVCFDDHCGERLTSARTPDITLFTDNELKTLLFVKEHFEGMSSKAISDYSHKEKAYAQTSTGDFIPYGFADELSI